MIAKALCLFLVPCDQIVNQAADTAGGCANAGSFLTARQRSEGCSRAPALPPIINAGFLETLRGFQR